MKAKLVTYYRLVQLGSDNKSWIELEKSTDRDLVVQALKDNSADLLDTTVKIETVYTWETK